MIPCPLIYLMLALLLSTTLPSQPSPLELGRVDWSTNYNATLKKANNSNKDVLILFQEVPGCATCRNFGAQPLSHPFIVEAIESVFIPLVIHNNKSGEDRKVLNKYNEPTWNNPVLRIVDGSGKSLQRLSGQYSTVSVLEFIISYMDEQEIEVPTYLSILQKELSNNNPHELYLGMYCFWSGEKSLANIDGVRSTQAGWMKGREVVKVVYDEDETSALSIIRSAKKTGNADAVYSK